GAQIAVLRGSLIAGNRGAPEGEPASRGTSRKIREARAATILKRATEIATDATRTRRTQVNEAESVMMQVVAVAHQLGIIPPSGGRDHTAYLEEARSALSNRAELVSHTAHVLVLVGR